MANIEIDGKSYETNKLSDEAKSQLASIQECDRKIRDLQSQLAIVQTARLAYGMALSNELPKSED